MKNILITLVSIFVLLYIVAAGSCMNDVKNLKNAFDIVFVQGSDSNELTSFVNDLKTAYPNLIVENTATDEDSLNAAAKFWNVKSEEMERYRMTVAETATAKVSIRASIRDLGSEKEFESFMSTELDKYGSLKLRQYAGTVPSNFFDTKINTVMCMRPILSIERLYAKLLFN